MISSKEIRLISSHFSFTDLYSLVKEFKQVRDDDNSLDRVGKRIAIISFKINTLAFRMVASHCKVDSIKVLVQNILPVLPV